MERSLSILLPVRNAQATLQHSVARLLDVAAEMTERFEILIVDDGSTDHTEEVAHDLAVRYPQVDVLRQAAPGGLAEVVRNGLSRTSGEIVCLHEGQGPVDIADLRELWSMREEEDLVLARRENRRQAGRAGFHMLRRSAIGALKGDASLSANERDVRLIRADEAISNSRQPQRPNFLTRLRDLALGE